MHPVIAMCRREVAGTQPRVAHNAVPSLRADRWCFAIRRLGLSHVFTGGCSQPNDGCSDTAQQAGADYNCYPRGATLPNSCPNKPTTQPLYDPVNK